MTVPPVIGSLVFDHANPKTNDYLMAQVQNATDADSDPISFTYRWSVNSTVVLTYTGTSPYHSIDLSQTGYGNKGDTISISVTPFDANDTGNPYTISTSVANSVPVIANNLTFYNSTPGTNDVLEVMVNDASDADGDTVSFTYVWSVNGTVVQTHSSEMMTDELHLDNPGFGDKGDIISVTITPSNNIGTMDYGDPLTIWTVVANSPPVIDASDVSSYTGDEVSLQIAGTDSDGDTLTISATGLPPGLSMDSTGLITGTISSTASTTTAYTVTVTFGDGSSSGSTVFSWTVESAIVEVSSPGDQVNLGGDSVDIEIPVSFVSDHSVSFAASNLPTGLTIDANTGMISGTIDASAISVNPYSVTITATDTAAGVSDQVTFSWTVSELILSTIVDQDNLIGDSVSLEIEASNASSSTLTYSASNLPPGLGIDSGTGVISGTISSTANSSPYSVTITVTNGTETVTSSFLWTAAKVQLNVPDTEENVAGEEVFLTIFGAVPVGDSLVFTIANLPSGLSIAAATGTISGTIDAETSGNFSVAVTATNTDENASLTKTITWTVAATNAGYARFAGLGTIGVLSTAAAIGTAVYYTNRAATNAVNLTIQNSFNSDIAVRNRISATGRYLFEPANAASLTTLASEGGANTNLTNFSNRVQADYNTRGTVDSVETVAYVQYSIAGAEQPRRSGVVTFAVRFLVRVTFTPTGGAQTVENVPAGVIIGQFQNDNLITREIDP